MKLIARFRVDGMQPEELAGEDADWFQVMILSKTFYSGIVGSATTVFSPAGSEEGARTYVATERISGQTDDGQEGAFTVQHAGVEWDPAMWFGRIVPHTGTGDFANWSGTAHIVHDEEGPFFEIDLDDA